MRRQGMAVAGSRNRHGEHAIIFSFTRSQSTPSTPSRALPPPAPAASCRRRTTASQRATACKRSQSSRGRCTPLQGTRHTGAARVRSGGSTMGPGQSRVGSSRHATPPAPPCSAETAGAARVSRVAAIKSQVHRGNSATGQPAAAGKCQSAHAIGGRAGAGTSSPQHPLLVGWSCLHPLQHMPNAPHSEPRTCLHPSRTHCEPGAPAHPPSPTLRHHSCSRLPTTPTQPPTLRQLENVFLAVDDLEAAPLDPHPHIPSVQPALVVQRLPRVDIILVVALENDGPAHADLRQILEDKTRCQ